MSAKITLRPSGDSFEAQDSESVLNAALRAGLSVDYGCNNGSCGRCRARLLSGEIARIEHHDFVLSEADKSTGQFLLCSNAATTDADIEVVVAAGTEDIPFQELTARVRKVDIVDKDTALLRLRTARTRTLRFIAGQHARLRFDENVIVELPIASCPCDSMNLEFHIRRDDGNGAARHVFMELKQDREITVEGPTGQFILDEDTKDPILLIAYDTAFAPIRSLIEHALSLERSQPIDLYWIVQHPRTHYLRNYCRSIADAIDNLSFTGITIGAPPAAASKESRTVHVADLEAALAAVTTDHPALADHQAYVAGPTQVIDTAERVLREHGLSESRLFTEISRDDPLRGFRDDDYLQVTLTLTHGRVVRDRKIYANEAHDRLQESLRGA